MGKKLSDTNHTGQIGISWLSWILEGLWGCGIETISAHNDNSLDILIFLKRREKSKYAGPTGDVIFAQVKTGYKSNIPKGREYSINLKKDYLDSHRPRWLKFPGPVIMINVIPPKVTKGTPLVFWTDLRDPSNFRDSGAVRFETKRKLDAINGKSELYNLCWQWAELRALPVVIAPSRLDWTNIHPGKITTSSESFHERCREFYSAWMQEAEKRPTRFSNVRITNRGWRHMTRSGRSKARMMQSLLLLPAASKLLDPSNNLTPAMLTKVSQHTLPSGRIQSRHYEGITVRVTFFERQEAVVRVIIESTTIREPLSGKEETTRTLYSIYEVARARKSM
ncbi:MULTISPECIES: DUF4365 domain-containing protein [unclassified Pseudomonas]|uniref:DUF4365 domain-containing protein n=1 Tax=unclassified Pseudomonas TaxID=196821 RepID=UPI0009F3437E|nr:MULTISPECIES: DUF4365 domain-containing protein [unclassified Pseudomonas]QOF82382.1 DUF4365 domain-containing protein [Pseudomonas sp. ADPe]